MDTILSEKDLMPSGISWGEWNFSLSERQIHEKISSLPKNNGNLPEICDSLWLNLFSLLPAKQRLDERASTATEDVSVVCLEYGADRQSPMECSPIIDSEQEAPEKADDSESSFEDVTLCLVDTCNQVAPKLKIGLSSVQEDMVSLISEVEKLSENAMLIVMTKTWTQLNSEVAKFCFCIGFSLTPNLCKMLCQQILLPWMSKSLPTKLQQFSEIFSSESEIFCRHLIAPLLLLEDSPLVKDLFSLEEVMNSMEKRHWTLLLTELLLKLEDLRSWNIPLLAMIVEQSEPTLDNVRSIVQLMSSTGTNFSQSRDFGSLLVAVANCLKPGYGSVVSQLKSITNNSKGPLKFKALNILSSIKE